MVKKLKMCGLALLLGLSSLKGAEIDPRGKPLAVMSEMDKRPRNPLVRVLSDGTMKLESIEVWDEELGRYVTIEEPEEIAEAISESGAAKAMGIPKDILNLIMEFTTGIEPTKYKHKRIDDDDDIYG